MFAKAKHQKTYPPTEEGLKIKIKVSEGMNNGCDFDIFAVLNNNTDAERLCRLMFGARTASYNGTLGPECGSKDLLNVALQPYAGKKGTSLMVSPIRLLIANRTNGGSWLALITSKSSTLGATPPASNNMPPLCSCHWLTSVSRTSSFCLEHSASFPHH